MKSKTVTNCSNCPFWARQFQDGCECGHPDSPKWPINLIGPYEAERNPPPSWCPLRKSEFRQTTVIKLK